MKKSCSGAFLPQILQRAFSLVEMLMALLVASLLLAALAPVMTKRMDETKINISGVGAAQYDKDAIVQVYTEDSIFNVPYDVNAIRLTMMGAGGAGGNAVKGDIAFTNPSSIQSWQVPKDVTKLRIFMIGGGGGGASGGVGNGTATIPAGGDGNTYKDFLTEGEHAFTIPSTATKVPDVDEKCKASGVSSWTGVSDGKTYTPGKVAVSVTACGGGGGGGGAASSAYIGNSNNGRIGGGGGSGGYKTNIQLSGTLSSLKVIVGGGGGGGSVHKSATGPAPGWSGGGGGASGDYAPGTATGYGGNGGESGMRKQTNSQNIGWSGVGGKPNGLPSSSVSGQKTGGIGASGAGTGGTGAERCDTSVLSRIAGGGGGGGIWGGGGGGGGSCNNSGSGGGGGGAATGITDTAGNILFQVPGGGGGGSISGGCCNNYAGGGGGGGGGTGGGNGGPGCPIAGDLYTAGFAGTNGVNGNQYVGGAVSTIFGSNYCNGGNGGASYNAVGSTGKPGALRLYYTYPALKCEYSLPANGGGGGGAGQITIGEINVTPGETLYFEVGKGGATQTTAGKAGNTGGATYIRRGSPTGTIIATALGGNPGGYTSSETIPAQGGAKRPVSLVKASDTTGDGNWLNKDFGTLSGYGTGGAGSLASSSGFGGKGGNSQFKDLGELLGGNGGNSVKNGATPLTNAYGAGGGGGAGTTTSAESAGIGAAGASGYIYIEYGGSNGGGGTAGEFISKRINVKPSTEMTIHVGRGVDGADGGETYATYEIGGNKTETSKARGGIRGNDGGMSAGVHGAVKLLIDAAGKKLGNFAENEDAPVNGKAGSDTYGGIGGFMQYLYKNEDGTDAAFVKDRDGKFAGPSAGGCGGNITSAMECNAQTGGPNGKQGVFGGGGGGGAIVDGVNGVGARGGDGFVIIEYKSTSI